MLSHFSPNTNHASVHQVKGSIVKASPYTACGPINNAAELKGHIALALRGDCMFAGKARKLQEAGAIGVIFIGEYYCRKHINSVNGQINALEHLGFTFQLYSRVHTCFLLTLDTH